MDIVNWLGENWLTILLGVTAVFTGLQILAKLTPTESDDKFIKGVLDVLNKVTFNIGKDKNAK